MTLTQDKLHKHLVRVYLEDTDGFGLVYHANYVNPQWPLEKIGSIGNHIFYKGKRTNG